MKAGEMEPPTNKSQQQETELLAAIPLPALALCLLWWIFLNPAAYTRAKALPGIQLETRLYRAMLWLISTMLIGFSIIPVIGLSLGLDHGSERLFPPHLLLWILSGVWLISLFYPSDNLLSPVRAITAGFIAFFVAFLADTPVSMFCISVVGVTLFAVLEDDLVSVTVGTLKSNKDIAIGVSLFTSIMLAFGLSLVTSAPGFITAITVATQARESVKKQKTNLTTRLVFAALPIAYVALIWVYWFGGWQVLGV